MLVSLLLPLAWAAAADAASASRLAVIKAAPDIALTTQEEKPLKLSDLRGKVVLIGFVFTTCNGTCPATTSRMASVQTELRSRGLLKDDKVRLLTVTLDPARDTPAALRKYAKLYDADPASWSFLTGAEADVARVLAAWDMWTKPATNGQLDHPSRVFLVDPKGKVREIYHLDFLKPKWVVEDMELLLKEAK